MQLSNERRAGIAAIAGVGLIHLVQAPAAWSLRALVSLGMGAGFVLSRTVGLPGFHGGAWELSGIVSLLLEGGFATVAMASVGRSRQASIQGPAAWAPARPMPSGCSGRVQEREVRFPPA